MKDRVGKHPTGITLAETLLAAAILAMAVAAVIMPFTAGAQCTAEDARLTLSVSLAEGLMEEILSKSFTDPDGKETGESSRSKWDDMDDYHGYSESAGDITAYDGAAVTDPAATGLTRQAAVEGVYVAGQDTEQPPTFLRITVEVQYRGRPLATLRRLAYANE